ncbi:HAD family hydrolase [Halobacteriales archaeon QH_10_67_13]|nr:MAG: HAD family hydrolase [Halobacteriales archaeon QH_10_67_13]
MSFSAAIVDLDGTVYRGGELLPGAARGVAALREAGLDVLFFSNNPTKDGATYAADLAELGIEISPDRVYSAGAATTRYLGEHHADDALLVIGSEGLKAQLREAGLALTTDPEAAEALVVSWTDGFDYNDLQAALDTGEVPFYGTDPDRVVPTADGRMPGSGAIVDAVAATIGHEPDAIFGKPSAVARRLVLDRLEASPEECLVVGDRLDTDLLLGDRVGMTTVLVLSGVTDRAAIGDGPVDPDHVLAGLGEVETVLEGAGRE